MINGFNVQITGRYEKCCSFCRRNEIFQTDLTKFYRKIGKEVIESKTVPSTEMYKSFLRIFRSAQNSIIPKQGRYKKRSRKVNDKPVREWKNITKYNVTQALTKSANFKSL